MQLPNGLFGHMVTQMIVSLDSNRQIRIVGKPWQTFNLGHIQSPT